MNPVLINGERTDKNRSEAEFRRERFEAEAKRDAQAAIEYLAPINRLIDDMFKGPK